MKNIPQNPLIDSNTPIGTIDNSRNVIDALSALMTGSDDLHHVNERAVSGIIQIFYGVTEALGHASEVLSTDWKAEYNKDQYDQGYRQGLKEGQKRAVVSG